MEPNIYSAPKSDVSVMDFEAGSIKKAVIVASLIDIIGTIVISIVIAILYGAYLASNGLPPEQVVASLGNIGPWSPIGILGGILGSLISVYSGYKCAQIANQRSYKATAVIACIGVAFGLALGASTYSTGENAFFSVLTVGSIFLGSWIFQRKFRAV